MLVVSGKATISNDGATIISLLDVVHPAAKTLVDISKSQDAEVCSFLPFIIRFDKVCHVLRCTARFVFLFSSGVMIMMLLYPHLALHPFWEISGDLRKSTQPVRIKHEG